MRRSLVLMFLVLTAGAAGGGPIVLMTSSTAKELAVLRLVGGEAFHRIGMDLQIDPGPAERALAMANSGRVDGDGLRVQGLEARYPHLVPVPEPLMRTEFSAVVKNLPVKVSGWASIKPYRVGILIGWKILEDNLADAAVLEKTVDYGALFRMLDLGRIDVAVYTRADAQELLDELGLRGLKIVDPPLARQDMILYLHESRRDLAAPLVQALRQMKADGTYQTLLAQAMSTPAH